MKAVQALTKADLIDVLRSMNLVTRDDLKPFATREDLKPFATREDLKPFATKNDILSVEKRLKRYINKTRRELAQSIANVATTSPTLVAFNELKQKVENISHRIAAQ